MRRIFLLFIVIIFAAGLMPVYHANADNFILNYDGAEHEYNGDFYNIKVNGEQIATDMPSVIIDNRTLVPIRAIFEKLGAEVYWVENEMKAIISLNSVAVQIRINDKTASINNKNVEMDVPAKIINERTMVPLRFIAEQLNYKVGWYPQEKFVTVDSVALGDITSVQNGSTSEVAISVGPCKNYSVMRLSNPDRIVIDMPNIEVQASGQKEVNIDFLKTIRYGQQDKKVARVVLDVTGEPKYKIENINDKLIVKLFTVEENTANGIKICIDPGHGGTEPGAIGNGYVEKNINLKLGLLLRDELKKCGFDVVMTRESDINLSLAERGAFALKHNSNAIISCHFNASIGGSGGTASGFESIYTFKNDTAKGLAQAIFDEATKLGMGKRGVWTKESGSFPGRSYFGVLRESEPIPGVIAEGLFIDNDNNAAMLGDPSFLTNLAKAYCRGICNAYGVKHVE